MLDRDEQEFSQIIEEGLEDIMSGRATLGEVLRKHPESAAVLQPELEAALWLISRKEQVASRTGFVSSSRKRVVDRVRQEATHRGTKRAFFGFLWPQQRLTFQWVAALVILIILFSGTGGAISVSQGALPGEHLYPVKRVSEQAALSLMTDDVQQIELRTQFTERRLYEVEALVIRRDYKNAAETLNDFEEGVNQVTTQLQHVSNDRPAQKSTLAVQLQDDLYRYAERLDTLKAAAPADVQVSLDRARNTSMSGALLATEVQEEINGGEQETTPTVIPAVTETATPVPTITPLATEVLPVITPQPEMQQTEPDPTNTNDQLDQEVDPKVTKTPKPTNENRPEKPPGKPDTPDSQDSANKDGSEVPKPPKEDKPTKTDKKDK